MIRSLFFMITMVMMAGTGLAEDAPPCPADAVPIQVVRAFKCDDVTTFSEANISSTIPGFSAFATAVTEHLAAKLAQEKICPTCSKDRECSLLQFVTLTVNSLPATSIAPLETRPVGVCRITSPWMDLVIEREPVPLVRGIFRYSERQLLADQAVLAGAQGVPPGVAMPLAHEEFDRYADLEYASSEIRKLPAKKPIEERVPPDLLWLFRRAWQNVDYTYFPGAAGSSMKKAMATGSESYTKIVIRLIDRCFESEGEDINYNSILDVDDPELLEQYKIVTSIIEMPIP